MSEKKNSKSYKPAKRPTSLYTSEKAIVRKLKIVVRPQFLIAFNMVDKFNQKFNKTEKNESLVPVGDKFYKYLAAFGAIEEYNFTDGCGSSGAECTIDITYHVPKSATKAYEQCISDFGTEIDISTAPTWEQPVTDESVVDKLSDSVFFRIFKYLNLYELSILERVNWKFFELIREHFSSLKIVDFAILKPLRESAIRILFIKIENRSLALLKFDAYQVLINEPLRTLFRYMLRFKITTNCLEITNYDHFYTQSVSKIFENILSLKLSGRVTDNIASYLSEAKRLTYLAITDPGLAGLCLTNLRNITCLNVTQCTMLTTSNLLEFLINNPKLLSLNIIGCSSLQKNAGTAIPDYVPKLIKLKLNAALIDISSPLSNLQLTVLHIVADRAQSTGKYIDNLIIKMSKQSIELEELSIYEWSINCTTQNLLNNFTYLKKIHFDDCSKIDPNIFVNIAMKQVLTELSLTNCPILSNTHCICFIKYCPKLYYMNFRFCPMITNSIIKDAIIILGRQPERKQKVTFTIRGTGIKPSSYKENIFKLRLIRFID